MMSSLLSITGIASSKEDTEDINVRIDIEHAINQIPFDQYSKKEQKNSQQPLNRKEAQQDLIDDAVDQFKALDETGEEIICAKNETVAVSVDDKVTYRCRSESEALGEDNQTTRGEAQTNNLIDDLLEKSNQSSTKKVEFTEQEIKTIETMGKSKAKKKESSKEQTETEVTETQQQPKIIIKDKKTEKKSILDRKHRKKLLQPRLNNNRKNLKNSSTCYKKFL